MKFLPTPLAGAYRIELEKHGDDRGFFARAFCQREFEQHGLTTSLVQINNSFNREKGTLRGLHYQVSPNQETKIVRCISGALLDVIVDVRPDSDTFGHHIGVELSEENRTMLYVPKGFAHGFITLRANTEALYMVDEFYAPQSERGLRWDDPALGIEWPIEPTVISEKDASWPDFNAAGRPTDS